MVTCGYPIHYLCRRCGQSGSAEVPRSPLLPHGQRHNSPATMTVPIKIHCAKLTYQYHHNIFSFQTLIYLGQILGDELCYQTVRGGADL